MLVKGFLLAADEACQYAAPRHATLLLKCGNLHHQHEHPTGDERRKVD